MARFLLIGLAVLTAVSAVGTVVARAAAQREAVQDAQDNTELLARAIVEPAISDELAAGDLTAAARFDVVMRSAVLNSDVVRVKLWDEKGRIVYSDERSLLGLRYALDPDEAQVLRTGRSDAEASDLTHEENRYERAFGALIEVYVRVESPSGTPLLFETYRSRRMVLERSHDVLLAFAPIALGGLVLMLLTLVPLVWSLARGLERAQAERVSLLRRAVDASSVERRRIAGHLHDGVVQSLAGSAFTLSSVAGSLGDSRAATSVREVSTELRQSVGALRSLLVEIYPPSLKRAGLVPALTDLTAGLRSRGIRVDLDLDEDVVLDGESEEALFRVAQEALRNVVKHADAHRVWMALSRVGEDVVELSVADDGRGFDPPAVTTSGGHIGLDLLHDAVRLVGGEVDVVSTLGGGTVVLARLGRRVRA